MKHIIISALLILGSFGCKENEAGFSGGNDTGKDLEAANNTGTSKQPGDFGAGDDGNALGDDPAGSNPPPVPTGTGGPLLLEDVPDQVVNSGETTDSYSETLHVDVKITGGEGTITLTYSTNAQSSNPGMTGARFYWRPGHRPGGTYNNEVGTYDVTVTATDSIGQTASDSFKVDIKPIAWRAIARPDIDDFNMITDVPVTEFFHPGREYIHEKFIGETNLNTARCVSFDPGTADIQLLEDPTIEFTGKSGENPFQHNQVLTYKYPKSEQLARGFDKMAFVTWFNFHPKPTDSVSSSIPAKPIQVFYSFARCLDGDEPTACKKNAIAYKGMSNFFFCSDYMPAGLDLKKMYCTFAAINGVSGVGCP